jgi:hypothetical protein
VNLPDRRSWVALLRAAAHWRSLGAITLIMRTERGGIVEAHALKAGCIPGLTEHTNPIKTRWLAGPEAFAGWLDRIKPRDRTARGGDRGGTQGSDGARVTIPGTVTPAASQGEMAT